MNAFAQFLYSHISAFGEGTALSLVVTAIVREWPEQFPNTVQAWWSWARNTGQQILSMKNIPIVPEAPAKEK